MQGRVVGTGFIGVVHVEALRRLGVEVVGRRRLVARARAAKPGLPEPYESFEAMLADDRVDVVHLTTPNHLHHPQVKAALAAGKHVVCEKPLAMTSAETARAGAARARRAGSSTARTTTSASTRSCTQRARGCARASSAASSTCTAATSRTGCCSDTDWNWRLEPEQGGELRAVADIGSHWLDLVRFVTGQRSRRGVRRPRHGASRSGACRPARSRPSRRGRGRRRARRAADDDRGPRARPAALRRTGRAARSSSRR